MQKTTTISEELSKLDKQREDATEFSTHTQHQTWIMFWCPQNRDLIN